MESSLMAGKLKNSVEHEIIIMLQLKIKIHRRYNCIPKNALDYSGFKLK
jgi:hypothetical protein